MDQMMAATQTKPVTSEQARPFIFSLRWACAWPAQRSSFREAGTAEQSTRSIPACQMKVVSWRQALHEPGNRRLCASKQPRDGNSRRRGCAAAGKRASRLAGRGRQRRRRAGRALQRRLRWHKRHHHAIGPHLAQHEPCKRPLQAWLRIVVVVASPLAAFSQHKHPTIITTIYKDPLAMHLLDASHLH